MEQRKKQPFISLREVAIALFALALGVLLAVAGPIRTLSRRSRRAAAAASSAARRRGGGGGGGAAPDPLSLSYQSIDSHARHPILCPTNTSAPELSVWLHFIQLNAWRVVFDDTIGRLEASPLMKHCGATLHLGSPLGQPQNATSGLGPGNPVHPYVLALNRTFGGRVRDTFEHGVDPAESGELTTLVKIQKWCQTRPDSYALYLHDKGTRRPSGQDSQLDTFFKQADWRKLQEYFLIEVFEDCLLQLDRGWNACGALLRKWPHLHYSGNFWWVRCDYIRGLPRVQDWQHLWETHFWAELYLGGAVTWLERKDPVDGIHQHKARMFNCFESRVSHYEHVWPRHFYAGRRCLNHSGIDYL
jgi:hypothetical protein